MTEMLAPLIRLSRSSSYSHLSKMPSSPLVGPTLATWPLTSVVQAPIVGDVAETWVSCAGSQLEILGTGRNAELVVNLCQTEGCCSVVLEPLCTLNPDVQYAMALDCMLARNVPQTDTIEDAFKISEYAIRCTRVLLCEHPI